MENKIKKVSNLQSLLNLLEEDNLLKNILQLECTYKNVIEISKINSDLDNKINILLNNHKNEIIYLEKE